MRCWLVGDFEVFCPVGTTCCTDVLSWQPLQYTALGTGCTHLLQCLGQFSLTPSVGCQNEYQLTGWVIITVAMVDVDAYFWADSQPKSIGLVWGLVATRRINLHSSNEPRKLSQWLWSWWEHQKHCCVGYYNNKNNYYYYPRDATLARVLSYGPVSVCLSVCHKSVFYWNGWMNGAGFGMRASFHPSTTVLTGNSRICKNNGTSRWNFVSDRSTGRVLCQSTELKRCSIIEMRWNQYKVSLTSLVWTRLRRLSSEIKFRVVEL